MVSKRIQKALLGNSAIRAMFVEGKAMAEKYGAENVYDFSLGNPATPAPAALNNSIRDLLDEADKKGASGSLELHGYMENAGYKDVREAIAENLNKRFGTAFDGHNIVMTVGAAGGLNIIFKTILDPGDEVIVFAPFFGEYRQYAANFDADIVTVNPDLRTFQPDLADFAAKITEKTKALIVNTPNNPTGVIYKPETMQAIAAILEKKQEEYGHDIYLISDEPYRELVYDGNKEDFLTKYYKNTIVGYSFSKSLSLPGERIGYVVVPNEASDAEDLIRGIEISNRTLGFVNAPSLIQKAVARCLDEKTDVSFYDENRKMLYDGLTNLGFTCIKPEGAFYLWVKSPVANEEEFVEEGKKLHLLMVKGSAFGCGGFVRLAYCVSHETIKNSLPAFAKLAEVYGLN
ncbi:pyridoxal phosphate-dependent aminotransferase [Roseburia sp. AM23-20]|uniref:pyridoxal phosphate-dependent aminotransferase n=1 Tax=Roseburia sp. AM23-20 TaxID=2292066 RepID=UPI000E467DED|nr:pyridoxal phosphate-dependent aminotransferase [Roseburia sp. AM23-20]RHF94747.1 pyridoxal phosphate-dependent aminotransferase [Roseburia sp. AM23-20]